MSYFNMQDLKCSIDQNTSEAKSRLTDESYEKIYGYTVRQIKRCILNIEQHGMTEARQKLLIKYKSNLEEIFEEMGRNKRMRQ